MANTAQISPEKSRLDELEWYRTETPRERVCPEINAETGYCRRIKAVVETSFATCFGNYEFCRK
jgi:hypothetical protein